MKNRPKITRVQLSIDPNEDYSLIGIVSAEPDYRLSLSLNKKLSLSLKNSKPVIIKSEDGKEEHFSRFTDHSGSHGYSVNLFSNRSGNSLLIKKLNKIDYLLQLHSYGRDFSHEDITKKLRGIDAITGVFSIE